MRKRSEARPWSPPPMGSRRLFDLTIDKATRNRSKSLICGAVTWPRLLTRNEDPWIVSPRNTLTSRNLPERQFTSRLAGRRGRATSRTSGRARASCTSPSLSTLFSRARVGRGLELERTHDGRLRERTSPRWPRRGSRARPGFPQRSQPPVCEPRGRWTVAPSRPTPRFP